MKNKACFDKLLNPGRCLSKKSENGAIFDKLLKKGEGLFRGGEKGGEVLKSSLISRLFGG